MEGKALCKICGSLWHYQTFCLLNPKNNKKLRERAKPIQKVGKETKKWLVTRTEWFRANPPNEEGYYVCYLCGIWMSPRETTLDHVIPRSNDPKLRYVFSNLKPCCSPCNNEKGSKVLEEVHDH